MTTAGRAFAGAVFGALLTLVLHPTSRPYLAASLTRVPPARLAAYVDNQAPSVAPPRSLDEASLWVQLAFERMNRRQPLSPGEFTTVLSIVRQAETREPRNAFWPQSQAALEWSRGNADGAEAAWLRAARCEIWSDHQTQRLFNARKAIAQSMGAEQAWQLGYLYYARSGAGGVIIERAARGILGRADLESKRGLSLRFATVANGEMLRTGARSVATGMRGANIVELAAYPAGLSRTPSPKRLWVGQNTLLNNLTKIGMADEAERARQIFGFNEGWRAFAVTDDQDDLPRWLSFAAIVTAGMTSALAVVATLGGVVWLAGNLLDRFSGDRSAFALPGIGAASLLFGAATWGLTEFPLAGLAAALCAGFLMVAPERARRVRPENLGPLFGFVVSTLALLCGLMVIAYLIGKTSGATALLPTIGVPEEYISTTVLPGLCAVLFGLLLLAVPMWSLVHRVGTPHVLALALRRFGAFLGIFFLSLGVLLGPVAVYADRQIGQTLDQLVGNEPVYYYLRQ